MLAREAMNGHKGLSQLTRLVQLKILSPFHAIPFPLVDDREFLVALSAPDYVPELAVWTNSQDAVKSVRSLFDLAWHMAQESTS